MSSSIGWVQLTIADTDGHRKVSLICMVGLFAAIVMAIVGLPPVDLHGPLHRIGIMDPLCGGTRAARFAAQGRWGQAWRYNPLGIVVVVTGGLALVRLASGHVLRRWLNWQLAWTPRRRRGAFLVLLLVGVAVEVRQQSRAALLVSGT
jgi:hypothetical protein